MTPVAPAANAASISCSTLQTKRWI